MNRNQSPAPTPDNASLSASDRMLHDGLRANDPEAFSNLYDRYAPLLLGVILNIVGDRTAACAALQTVFGHIKARTTELRPNGPPLLPWLLTIARQTAIETEGQLKNMGKSSLQVSATGVVSFGSSTRTPGATSPPMPAANQLQQLLDAVLLQNCTPEEAAASLGLPVGEARHYLRLAMQQIRQTQAPA